MNNISNGLSIIVESTNKRYHTLDDWGFALGNTNYIGDPEAETKYISIPGRDGLIDISEAITGRTVYKKRELSFSLGGIRPVLSWDTVISDLRNKINGKVCQITLDSDLAYFWRGRVFIEGFDRMRELGQFTLKVPEADPYKYNVEASSEPWKWDPFNFETGVISEVDAHHIVGTGDVTIPAGAMYVSPEFVVSNMVGDSFTVIYKGKEYALKSGTTRIPPILINGYEEETLTFVGTGDVLIVYRGGSL